MTGPDPLVALERQCVELLARAHRDDVRRPTLRARVVAFFAAPGVGGW